MYFVTAPDRVPSSASFKGSDEEFEELSIKPGFSPAQNVARYKWVYFEHINRLSKMKSEY